MHHCEGEKNTNSISCSQYKVVQFPYEDIINLDAAFVISFRELDERNLASFEIYRQLTSEAKLYKNK